VPDIRVTVRVKPGSSRARVGGSYGPDGQLVVAVNAPPIDGAANEAVLRAVADAAGIRPRQVTIASGHTARTKILILSVDEGEGAAVAARLADLLGS
jgi:uncharacterized protein